MRAVPALAFSVLALSFSTHTAPAEALGRGPGGAVVAGPGRVAGAPVVGHRPIGHGRAFGHAGRSFGPHGAGRGRFGACGVGGFGCAGGLGLGLGLGAYGYGVGGFGYGLPGYGLTYGGYGSGYGGGYLPLPPAPMPYDVPGLPIAAGIQAPPVLPPAIYVVGSGRSGSAPRRTTVR